MEDYASNSNKKKQEKKQRPEKIVQGEIIQKERTFGQKLKHIFFGGEFKSAAKYIAADVLLPAARNLVVDATTKGIERMVYGETYHRRHRIERGRPQIQYNNPIRRGFDPRERVMLPDQPPRPIGRAHQTGDIILADRTEAELVLERLTDILDKYEVVSLMDLYDLLGLESKHTDDKWGWTWLGNAHVTQVRQGYLLELPPVEEI